jgi:hypothetical protein
VSNILSEAKFIKSSLGELPQGLAQRLVDSNSKIAQSTLGLCENLAVAIGSPIKQHIRVLFPGIMQCLGDSKVHSIYNSHKLQYNLHSDNFTKLFYDILGVDSHCGHFLYEYLGRSMRV